MTECFRTRLRVDVELVFHHLAEDDEGNNDPGWYFEGPGHHVLAGPTVTREEAIFLVNTIPSGVVFRGEARDGQRL